MQNLNATWATAHRNCEHFNGKCLHADPNWLPTSEQNHPTDCVCNVCGDCPDCQNGTAGPIGTYCLRCHRTQRGQ